MKADDNKIRYERAKQRMNGIQEGANQKATHRMNDKTPAEKEEMIGQRAEIITLGSPFIVL